MSLPGVAAVFVAYLAVAALAYPQTPTSGGTATGSNTSNSGTPKTSSAPAASSDKRPSDDYLRSGGSVVGRDGRPAPIILSGQVVLASGGAPSEPVLIRRVCGGGISIPEDYTDTRGRFQFQVGSYSSSNQTASLSREQGPFDVSGCSLVAEAPGFRSSSILLSQRRYLDSSGIGKIILTPLAGAEAAFTSITSLVAPKKAKSSVEKALKELAKGPRGGVDRAIDELEKAVAIYPEYAAAWSILGQVRMEAGNVGGGEADLKEAIRIDPRYLRPYEPLIRLRMSQNDWDQVNQLADYVLAITPTDPTILWYKALASFRTDRHDEAISFIGKALQEEGAEAQFPQTHQVLALIYAGRGEYQAAANEYRRYLEFAPNAESRDAIERQLEEWKQRGLI